MLTTTRMQLLAQFLQVQTPGTGGRCRSEITSMQGTYTFRRDQTTKLIKCMPWSTRLHPHPQLSRK